MKTTHDKNEKKYGATLGTAGSQETIGKSILNQVF